MLQPVERPRPLVRVVQPRRVEDPHVPLQVDVDEQDLEQQGEPEGRHRVAEEAERGERVVEERVLPDRREDPDGDAEDDRHRLREDDQLRGVPERPRDVGPQRLERRQRPAELVGEHVLDPEPVAHRDRAVQVVLQEEVVERVRGEARVRAQGHRRVACQRHEREAQERRHDQHRNAVEDPPDDVGDHGSAPWHRRGRKRIRARRFSAGGRGSLVLPHWVRTIGLARPTSATARCSTWDRAASGCCSCPYP